MRLTHSSSCFVAGVGLSHLSFCSSVGIAIVVPPRFASLSERVGFKRALLHEASSWSALAPPHPLSRGSPVHTRQSRSSALAERQPWSVLHQSRRGPARGCPATASRTSKRASGGSRAVRAKRPARSPE